MYYDVHTMYSTISKKRQNKYTFALLLIFVFLCIPNINRWNTISYSQNQSETDIKKWFKESIRKNNIDALIRIKDKPNIQASITKENPSIELKRVDSSHTHTHDVENENTHVEDYIDTSLVTSYDQKQIKKYWWFKWIQQKLITEVLEDKEITNSVDKTIARIQLQDLSKKYQHLHEQFVDLRERKDLTDKKRKQVSVALNQTQKTTQELQESSEKRIEKIEILEKAITKNKWRLKILIPNIIESEKEVALYTKMFYKMHHDVYASKNEISMIKLFSKHHSVAHTLASEIMIEDLTETLSSLIIDLGWYKEEYSEKFIQLHDYTTTLNNEVKEYKKEKQLIDQQLKNFEHFLNTIERDKNYIDNQKEKLEKIQSERKDQDTFLKSLVDIHNSEHLEEFTEAYSWDSFRIQEETFFDFPIPEIKKITSHFEDEWYGRIFNTNHYALDFRLAQWSFVYAPAPWYVLKVVDQDSPLLNRIIIIHQQNFATVYLHMQDIFLDQWMFVNKWDIIWLSWWTPWTKGAWLMTTWPHLHREVRKDGELADPLMYTDLSLIKHKKDLQKKHIQKRNEDKKNKPQIFKTEKTWSEVKKEIQEKKNEK